MTEILDGSSIDYNNPIKKSIPNFYSWGWLGSDVPKGAWPSSDIKDRFLARLADLKVHSRYRGSHNCEVCGKIFISNGSRSFERNGKTYQCPAGVDHYIIEHDYCPPMEVIIALLGEV